MNKTKNRRSVANLFWGRTADLILPTRVVSLLFVVASIASLTYCQLGFWSMGLIDSKPVYIMLLLGPLILGAFLFGPITGGVLGLYAGLIVYLHKEFFPLDYYEVYFMTPLNTFVLLALLGVVAGLLFNFVLRRDPQGVQRFILIASVCVVISLAASGLMMVNVVIEYGGENLDDIKQYLFSSTLGVIVQAAADVVLMLVLCLYSDVITRRMSSRGGDRTLLAVFRNWMLLVSAIVFMLANACIFSISTVQAMNSAEKNMVSEIKYLKTQIAILEEDEYGVLLEGYSTELDGYAVIMDKNGTILATDDNKAFPIGANYPELIGQGGDEGDSGESFRTLFDSIDEAGTLSIIPAMSESGASTMEFAFITVGSFDGGYASILRTTAMVYTSRFDTMVSATSLAILLIISIAILATILLNRIVVRHVDETNASLLKITDGNLNERVRVNDSREFISLSAGINSTVSALKSTIEEVEQRNAQDLATAKTIQESALPRDFPPFPHIDKFDIYASMKTAKEVGGDFYDFFLIDDNKLGFIIADVSGKGIPAALFMMAAKTQIKNFMEAGLPVGEAVDAANYQLCIGNDAGMFVTMYVCLLDYETGMLSYVNAGHNPPLLLHDGTWEWLRDVSGMPLGLYDGIPYDEYSRQLEPEDVVYLYTDGVTEAMDLEGRLFGDDRLKKVLYEFASMNPRSVGVGVRRALTDFTKDAEQSDDITMLIMKYGVPPEKQALMILPAVDTQLVHVCNFIHEELHRRSAPKPVYNSIDIAAEELFVNVCHYAYPEATEDNPGEVRISFEYEATPPALTVQIADDGVPYNPLDKPDAVTPDNIEDVPIGGLGILMSKRSVDEMSYERVGKSNIVTIVKRW